MTVGGLTYSVMSCGIVALFFAVPAATAVPTHRLDGRRTILVARMLFWIGLGLLVLAETLRSARLCVNGLAGNAFAVGLT